MGEIKRYTRRMWGDLDADPDGELVGYDDHAAELARLRAVVADYHERARHPLALMGDPCPCPDCIAHRASAQDNPST